jgi:propionyl-CoA carboxylase beta chain
MSSKHLGGDVNLAWPTAEIAVMGAQAAMDVLYAKRPPEERALALEQYEDEFMSPLGAAQLGYVDEVIEPRHTRRRLIEELRLLITKQRPIMSLLSKRHSNEPL